MADRISIQNFKKKYNDTYLLNPSESTYKVGCQFEKEYNAATVRTNFEIGSFFINYIKLDDAVKDKIREYLERIAADAPDGAVFAALDINTNIDIKANLKIPIINTNIGAKTDVKKVAKISFEEVCTRSLLHEEREHGYIVNELNNVKTNNSKLFKSIEKVCFLHNVYYAKKVSIELIAGGGATFEAQLLGEGKAKGADFSIKGNVKTSSTFVFEGNLQVPFAARVESLGDLAKGKRGK